MLIFQYVKEVIFMYKTRGKLQYLDERYSVDKLKRKASSKLKTGLPTIDENLNIRHGVYLIGGLPSVGKTSLILQLADTFAKSGREVLFFSLEQEEYDLTRKSLNRIMSQEKLKTEEQAIGIYKEFANNITTVTSHSVVTIEEIETVLKDYMNGTHSTPIVFVDYLQLIRTDNNMGKRDTVMHVSNILVNMAKQYRIPLFVLSALNRTNYLMPIDFEAFKESGSLEYDADVVFGIQYQLVEDEAFMAMPTDKKRKMINQEKINDIRKVELVCVKNRFGRIVPKCKLDYYTQMDWFVEGHPDEKYSKTTITL